jgi:hypothetical protein
MNSEKGKNQDMRFRQMIKHGPIDVIVLASAEPRLEGHVYAELKKQAAAGTIGYLMRCF